MAIQDKECGGQLLLVYPFPVVSAGLASRAIKFSLQSGWEPGIDNKPMRVACDADFVFHVLPHLEPKDVLDYLGVRVQVRKPD